MSEVDIPVDKFQYLALEAKNRLATDLQMEQNDLSDLFWEVAFDKVDHKELFNCGVVGEIRKGKSTIAIYIAWRILRYLDKKTNRTPSDIGRFIFSDQTEFLRFIKQEAKNVCISIDEFNGMAETGLNATTEAALFDYYSDVFAAQYVHRVCCSPATLVDKNTTIILTVLGRNDELKITRCRLSYRNPVDKSVQLLGYVDFYVGDLLTDPYYEKYYAKKMKRMDLISKEGIRDIRELEFGLMTIKIWEQIKELTSSMSITRDIILSFVNDTCRREGRIYSELAKNEIAQRVAGIAILKKEFIKIATKKAKTQAELERNQEAQVVIQQVYHSRLEEERRLATLYDEYLNITV